MTSNTSASAVVPVVVASSGSPITTLEVRVSPTDMFVLQGDVTDYTVQLYSDGVLQGDAFTFAVTNVNVPSDRYLFHVIDGNSFSVTNVRMYLNTTLDILCTSGTNTRTLNILLKGAW
jgi:hypothetical protein